MALTMSLPGNNKDHEVAAREARTWLLTLTSGRATEADAEAFREWLRADPQRQAAFAAQKQLWRDVGPAVQAVVAEDARNRARKSLVTGRRAFLGGALAASAAYLAFKPPLGLWPGLDVLGADYRTAAGEQRRVALGNAVDVQMNTQTRINVSRDGDGAVIELADGEAEIRSGPAAAVVVAGKGRITAKDALFNVRYIDGEARLCCLSGVVRLAHEQGVFDIVANRELRYDDRRVMPPVQVDPAIVTAWRQGWLVFDQQPLAQVVDELNRYRRGRLVLMNDQLGKRLVQARFSLAQVADAERLIRDAYGARVTRLPAGVVVLS
ncbi:ferric-dicitrate binding protein FerR (iron transport regulator) [Achromobacter deleyi]|uniref:FecR family protein n=1 Tax=Achromobacter TaxID=222 RepID=UPI002858CBD2|nr:FecR domain-containing protein [Achromobacter deleyi]MDR6601017.1 ferric-dicitrate binding protein FerR (iron transport regulator) [Achromobacter deleyi]